VTYVTKSQAGREIGPSAASPERTSCLCPGDCGSASWFDQVAIQVASVIADGTYDGETVYDAVTL
jgi:hypothetical protein